MNGRTILASAGLVAVLLLAAVAAGGTVVAQDDDRDGDDRDDEREEREREEEDDDRDDEEEEDDPALTLNTDTPDLVGGLLGTPAPTPTRTSSPTPIPTQTQTSVYTPASIQTPTPTPTPTRTSAPAQTSTPVSASALRAVDDGGGVRDVNDPTTPTPTRDVVVNPTVTPIEETPTATPTTAFLAGPDTVVTDLAVNRSVVPRGEPVKIVATIENRRLDPATTEVRLRLFGEPVAVREVSIPAAGNRTVAFVQTVEAAGEYRPSVNRAETTFRVEGGDTPTATTTPTSGDGAGFTTGGALVGCAVLLWRRVWKFQG